MTTVPVARAALRPVTMTLLVVVMLAAVPAPALAQLGVRHWLEKLSGPGPFTAGVIYASPLCYGYKKKEPSKKAAQHKAQEFATATANATSQAKKPIVPARRPMRHPPKPVAPLAPPTAHGFGANPPSDTGSEPAVPEDHPRLFPAWECTPAFSDMPNWYFYYEFSWDRGGKSNLQYSENPEENQSSKVGIQTHLVGFTFSTHPAVEVGAGIGGIRFAPNRDDREAFWRLAVEPVRVHFRPLAIVWPEVSKASALMVTAETLVVVGRLRDGDFGALPGTYTESNELVPSFSLAVDLFRLFSRD